MGRVPATFENQESRDRAAFLPRAISSFNADVAQLVEQLIRNQQVGGSTPLVSFFIRLRQNTTAFSPMKCLRLLMMNLQLWASIIFEGVPSCSVTRRLIKEFAF